MHSVTKPLVRRSRLGWHSLPVSIMVLLLGLFLALPSRAQAMAVAMSDLSFTDLSIVPMIPGAVTLLDPWALEALATAQNSLGDLEGEAPSLLSPGVATANAMVTYAQAHGEASALNTPPDLAVTGSALSNVTIPGCPEAEAFATGRGTLSNLFTVTGGTTDNAVQVEIGATLNGSLNVMTDVCGVYAETEIIFRLSVIDFSDSNGVSADPLLFYQTLFSIAPNNAMSTSVSTFLSETLDLQFGHMYFLLVSVDSESHARTTVPEPSTLLLLFSGCLGLLLTGWMRQRRTRLPAPRTAVTRLSMSLLLTLALVLAAAPAQAKYIGAEPPSASCCKCGTGRPCTEASGRNGISLSEGNLQEQQSIASLNSSTGATMAFSVTYNSYNADGSRVQLDTVMGYGWTHSYNILLFSQLGHMFRMDGDGRVTKYKLGAGGTFTTAPGYFETLVKMSSTLFILTQKDKTEFRFESIPGTPFLVGGPVYRLTRITDRNNNITTFTYSSGNLTSITDTYGRSLDLTYTVKRKLATVRDPLGRTTTFTYDATGRQLRSITDPAGKTTQYTYDVSYRITRKIDKDGRIFTYSYDTRGNPLAMTDSANNPLYSLSNPQNWATDSTALARDLLRVYLPTTTSKTDGRGNVWKYTYDNRGYITQSIAPDNATTVYTYDPSSLMMATMTDANGHTTMYQYDSQGNVINKTDHLGHMTTYTYEPTFNMMTSMTDANGRTTTYEYDARGNRIKETDPLPATRQWTYDSHGNVLTEQDRNGNVTMYQYDSTGNRMQMTDAVGNSSTMTYDAVGNLLSRTDANNHTTLYQYDALNRLIKETDPANQVTQTFYDGQNNRTQVIDRNGNTTTYTYDLRQRPTKTTDALNQTMTQSYDGNNNRTAITDKNGHTTMYQYDVQNRLTQTTDAIGNMRSMSYDGVGNRLTDTDANGHTTMYQYDALNRPTRKTDAEGNVTQIFYDMADASGCVECTGPTEGSRLLTAQIDAEGKVTYFKYDALDRMIRQIRKEGDTADSIDASDAVTRYTYDAQGNQLSMTEPNGNTTNYVYDGLHRRVAMTNAAGDMTLTTYDPVSNVKTVTAPNGNVTTYTYDALDRRIQVDDSAGRVANYTYDAVGNRLMQTDGNTNGTTSTYDTIYRITAVTDALGSTTRYTYDPVGNLLQLTDREGNITTYMYDNINRRTQMADALGNVTQYQYDGVGNLTQRRFIDAIDAKMQPTDYAYDNINRLIQETYADGKMRTFAYDRVSNLKTRTDQKGQTTTYVYNDLYFLVQRDYPVSPDDTMTYDLSGRLLSAERDGWLVTFVYDAANRVTKTTQNGKAIQYSYNIPGRMRTLTYPGGRSITESTDARHRLEVIDDAASATPIVEYIYDQGDRAVSRMYRNGTMANYTYNANDWIEALDHTSGITPMTQFQYDFDNEGNKKFELKFHAPSNSEGYKYDNLYRLIDFKVGTLSGSMVPMPLTQTQYDLDGAGNWRTKTEDLVSESRMHSITNEITHIGAVPVLSDLNGNTSNDGVYSYLYDEENRLTAVIRNSDSRTVGQYRYDALSRRVKKIADPAVVSSPVHTFYFYDDARILEEQNSGGVTLATYVYGNYLDEVLTMDRGAQTYYYHQNSLLSVAAITDSAGIVVEHYHYDAYGLPMVFDGSSIPMSVLPNAWGTPHSAIDNPWLFTGRQFDEETGLYFYRARYYDPLKGRFLQRDPLGYIDGMNLYTYVNNGPTQGIDPFGLLTTVSSKVAWEYWQRYVFSGAWRWAGDTVVNTELDVSNQAVDYVSSNPDTSPVNFYKNSWALNFGHNLYFTASGYGKEVKCPCVDDRGRSTGSKTWKGVFVYHLHVMSEDSVVEITKVVAGVSGKLAKKDVGEIGVNLEVELKINNPNAASTRWFKATVCPDGQGGITISDKDTNEASHSNHRGTTYTGIIQGTQKARGHAK